MNRWLKRLYLLWALLVFLIVFIKGGLSADNLTHAGITLFFFFALWLYRRRKKPISNPRAFFILRCVLYAAVVEGFYMITAPVLPSLRFTAGMTLSHMVANYLIDLSFTVPAYLFIFYVVWRLIKKYSYTPWEYAILFAFGQALGDGSRTFLFNPGLLVFIPYVMINYHAMNVAPFLSIRENLQSEGKGGLWKWFAPIVVVFGAYLISGLVIYSVAAILKIS
jgi:hypothetical protein